MIQWIEIYEEKSLYSNGNEEQKTSQNNKMNWFTKWVNRFRLLKDNLKKVEFYEDWYASNGFLVDSDCPEWMLIRFKPVWIDSD